jgi:hypothetical protein
MFNKTAYQILVWTHVETSLYFYGLRFEDTLADINSYFVCRYSATWTGGEQSAETTDQN